MGRSYPQRVYFGDTHHHTRNSGDAIVGGNRLGPEESSRFALGEEVVSSSGVPARLSRPLDFLVITDHAEGHGVVGELIAGNTALTADETMERWSMALRAGGQAAVDARTEISRRLGSKTLPALAYDQNVIVPVMRSVWQKYTAIADRYNQPGRFTALLGFEWMRRPTATTCIATWLAGATGQLTLAEGRRFARDGVLAEFRRGQVVPADATR